ncbi:MAG: DNA methylase [Clostridia bacterium]|nr:DNA methylase [Clostridia bacterium]
MTEKAYIAIDLKSFYASVECLERGLDPMTVNLVVADESRTEKTIGLAVSPSLKSFGISGRPRLFEVVEAVRAANDKRRENAPNRRLIGASYDINELNRNPALAVDYIVAPPRMAYYMEYSTRIYQVYLKYVAPEDIHAYSIDEVFIDATPYLKAYGLKPKELAMRIIRDVLNTTGITATAGIGTNLYLCKVAMDIVAKHIPADEYGVRIAELDEMSYRKTLWDHRPLTDFWRVGHGYQKKLESVGLCTMGDIAKCSLGAPHEYYNEELLYKLFGINAELLIDHAWGWEPCTLADIKAYRPESNSICSGQVLQAPYPADKARLVVREMTDAMALELVDKGLVTDQMVLTVGYDVENLKGSKNGSRGEIQIDRYGREIPKHAHGTETLTRHTSSTTELMQAVLSLYDRIVNPKLLVRRITLSACRVVKESDAQKSKPCEQLDVFSLLEETRAEQAEAEAAREKEKRIQSAMLGIRKKYGKNAILKGTSLEEGATAKERNAQIGGHKA